ncbi:DivIVA domain-containing protein [Blastococcus sp. KM273128]|uniref:DivIVA domain-containing protein n=1 Tax=Blastococcus sp. KM273128 TaxID=2570314 RepID=UPI001F293BE3|nr:DivIVA domain-containing protein [Blastococcus sp. KM273128]
MLRRVEFVANRVQDEEVPPDGAAPAPRPSGGLEVLLDHGPSFRGSVRGYDRVQVDNYVAWAENELAAAQREREHLLDRVVACGTELEISRRLLAEQPAGRERPSVSARVAEVLRLAEDQAAQVLDAAEAEAAQLRADARLEADARLRKAHEIKELAIDVADQLRVNAQRDRAEGTAALEQAQAQVAELLRAAAAERDRLAAEAAAERDRLAAEAAAERDRFAAEAAAERERAAEQAQRERAAADDAARAHLATLRAEVEDLCRQRDQARESLRCLTDRIGAALQAVGVPPAEELALLGSRPEPVG